MRYIVVPSIGRAGSCASMKWLRDADREIIFAIHLDEREAYRRAYPDITTMLILDEKCRHHTGLVRKEIMAHMEEPFFFVDDDIRISLKAVQSVKAVFDVLEQHMKGGASMAGLAPQLFSTYAKTELINSDVFAQRNKFVATVYGIDPRVFDDCPLERLPVYEDIALVIHAIQHGGGTVASYIATHSNVSPKVGGCNSWRNEQVTLESLLELCRIYPEFCSIRETTNTTHSQNIGLGLRVAWSKITKL